MPSAAPADGEGLTLACVKLFPPAPPSGTGRLEESGDSHPSKLLCRPAPLQGPPFDAPRGGREGRPEEAPADLLLLDLRGLVERVMPQGVVLLEWSDIDVFEEAAASPLIVVTRAGVAREELPERSDIDVFEEDTEESPLVGVLSSVTLFLQLESQLHSGPHFMPLLRHPQRLFPHPVMHPQWCLPLPLTFSMSWEVDTELSVVTEGAVIAGGGGTTSALSSAAATVDSSGCAGTCDAAAGGSISDARPFITAGDGWAAVSFATGVGGLSVKETSSSDGALSVRVRERGRGEVGAICPPFFGAAL